jgi:hypothetical protein
MKVFDSIVGDAEIACVLHRMQVAPFTMADLRRAADDAGVIYTYEFCQRMVYRHRSSLRRVAGKRPRAYTYEWIYT